MHEPEKWEPVFHHVKASAGKTGGSGPGATELTVASKRFSAAALDNAETALSG